MGIAAKICHYLPTLGKKIVFSNFNGRGYGDSPKYIAEEIRQQGLPYDLVWLVSNLDEVCPKGIRKVLIYSKKARFELSTAKVIISNVKFALPFSKKNSQFFIQTWHGDFGFKYIEKEAEDKLDRKYLIQSKMNSEITDLILSGSRFFSKIVRESFWYNGEIFEVGIPRQDPYFHPDPSIHKKVCDFFATDADSRLALYCPTFRDDHYPYSFPDFAKVLDILKRETGNTWKMVIRFHPNDLSRMNEIAYSDTILNGTFLPDVQELNIAADFLITDFSSIMYDFALQSKPVLIYASDLDHYTQSRGLRPIFWKMPYRFCKNDQELDSAIPWSFSSEAKNQVDDFLREEVGVFDHGEASQKVVERIKTIMDATRVRIHS